jgi:hypothetical protein
VVSLVELAHGGAAGVIGGISTAAAAPASGLRDRDIALGLDDVDSLTMMSIEDRAVVGGFLSSLTGGRIVVLYAARASMAWLAPVTFGADVHVLPALDPDSAIELASTIPPADHPAPLVTLGHDPGWTGIPGVVRALTTCADEERDALRAALFGGAPDRLVHLPEVADALQILEPESMAVLPYLAPLTRAVPLALLDALHDELGAHGPGLDAATFAIIELDQAGLARETRPGHIELHPLLLAHLRAGQRVDPELERAWAAIWLREAPVLWSASQMDTTPGLRSAADVAARHHLPSIEWAVHAGVRHGMDVTFALGVVANILSHDERWQDLHHLATTVTTALRGHGAPPHAVGAAIDLQAFASLKLDHTAEAQRCYVEALDLFADVPALAASVHHQLGRLTQDDEPAVAERHFRRAIELAGPTGQPAGRALHQLGYIAQQRGRSDEARHLFAAAANVFETIADKPAGPAASTRERSRPRKWATSMPLPPFATRRCLSGSCYGT